MTSSCVWLQIGGVQHDVMKADPSPASLFSQHTFHLNVTTFCLVFSLLSVFFPPSSFSVLFSCFLGDCFNACYDFPPPPSLRVTISPWIFFSTGPEMFSALPHFNSF
ncbi:hypothetical protein CRENBAI_023187 [Crenichthys baileyi]|uniref:Uncharacterized protein n=1 Tax=Crenichthys baileyi TaxID=28760 RepID=A0AAV9REK7_9TELE